MTDAITLGPLSVLWLSGRRPHTGHVDELIIRNFGITEPNHCQNTSLFSDITSRTCDLHSHDCFSEYLLQCFHLLVLVGRDHIYHITPWLGHALPHITQPDEIPLHTSHSQYSI
jgi:hypothetical protein